MVEDTSTDLYYRGNDLMQPQQKLLFQKIQQTIQQEQGEIVYILSSLENNSHRYQQLQKEQESLATNEENLDKLQTISQQMASIHTTQNDLLFTLQPMFNQLFDQIGRETQ